MTFEEIQEEIKKGTLIGVTFNLLYDFANKNNTPDNNMNNNNKELLEAFKTAFIEYGIIIQFIKTLDKELKEQEAIKGIKPDESHKALQTIIEWYTRRNYEK